MSKLTDTQLVILANAAKRVDGVVFPLPKSLKIKGGALKATLDGLRKKGLLTEHPAAPDAIAWREDPDRGRLMLVLTEAGLQAIGADASADPQKQRTPANSESERSRRHSRQSKARSRPAGKVAEGGRKESKQALLLTLLKRKGGASIEELQAAVGWQAHSVRGFLAGAVKQKLGFTLSSDKVAGQPRRYRLGPRS
ncbi:MAG: DUF3489 domain-containing protein [Rhodospirillales bacterium]|nr:DUF3489 domain-containing protein [Rhodospirillales bacterium]